MLKISARSAETQIIFEKILVYTCLDGVRIMSSKCLSLLRIQLSMSDFTFSLRRDQNSFESWIVKNDLKILSSLIFSLSFFNFVIVKALFS